MLYILLLSFATSVLSETVFYHSYSGNELTKEDVKPYIKQNSTFWCINEIMPCDPNEGRRIDGSCNNLKYPSRGAAHTPNLRLLPPEYDTDYEPRKTKSGEALPLARSVRTTVMAEGRVPDTRFTQLLLHFFVYIAGDLSSVHDTVNYVVWTPYCCEEKGKTDKQCIQIKIPDDDPVHRFSSIRCLNLTRPESFQSRGCLKNNTLPERIITATPAFDLSQLYGVSLKHLNAKGRKFEKGLLKFEVANGKIWPPSTKTKDNLCVLNKSPHETRCHDTPEDIGNSIVGSNLLTIWSWRLHNRIATGLAGVNPCWDDEKLFYMARELNIAIMMQILYYELMPTLMGYDNLVRNGVLSPFTEEFRDIYNDDLVPQKILEFGFVLRWGHTIQEGKLKMYDSNGVYLKDIPVVNLTLRTGYLEENLEYITHGAFRQPSAKFDYVVDPDIAEQGLGPLQLAADLLTTDLTKNRYFGFPPYIKYRKLCSGKTYRTFDDLLDVIDPERIELLKEKYKDVEDIDLMAGIWLERPVQGGHVPVTFFCIVAEQMRRNVASDRHWYERPNRPNGFTLEQLLEVRKASIAQILCAVGDKVTTIQPHAFNMAGPGNEMRSCKEIQKMNLWAWRDQACNNSQFPNNDYNL